MINKGLKKELSLLDLTMASLGAIIGSGWLLASQAAAQGAGPSAIFSWVIGGVVVMLIGLVYAELGGLIPESGGIARYPHYSHGHLTSFIMGWAAFLAYASVPAVEAEGVVTYAQSYIPAFKAANGNISALGLLVAAALMALFFIINYYGVKSFAKVNTPVTLIKFIMPSATVLLFLFIGMHWSNLTVHGFAPYHSSGMMKMVSTAGIVFSFLGFRQAVDLAGEAKHPQRDVPRAVVYSLIIGILLYVLLQLVFIGGVPSSQLAKGWSALSYSAPFAQLAVTLGMGWFATLLYADAILSPAGTGNIYLASTSRVLYALANNRYFPKALSKVDPKTGVPSVALITAFIMGLIFLAPFPAWQKLVGFVSSATVLTSIIGPISAAVFRRVAPNAKRPVKLGGMNIIAPLAFIGGSFIIYWTGWAVNLPLLIAMLVGLILYAIATLVAPNQIQRPTAQSLKAGIWLIVYLLFMLAMSYYGSSVFGAPANHGKGAIHYPLDLVVIAIGSLLFYYWGVASGYKTKDVEEVLEALDETREAGAL
ncbi:Amino acid transporter [Sulfobacillus thermosulfidooxidans DSM 9293]|uniref:Amino acid transporter n=1 Tax=Sulfobacillus thermosulfidooxidans (strain DSM 9293 / VKM B-1269 / AT-1) TaxID=929705 RepID=A0A1W1W774_SULTA|nr:APC family permease [Sulfobacillus thermosulfidooxidans]SMC02136.1 Amino acid transporter [Sulfobacillus thermosulfidooxidans DSM 9293]